MNRLLIFAISICSSVASASEYLYVDCRSQTGDGSGSSVFTGHLVSEEGASVQNGVLVIVGRKTRMTKTRLDDAACIYTYEKDEYYTDRYGNEQTRVVTKPRQWNALALSTQASTVYIGCALTSYVETFDSKEDWLAHYYQTKNLDYNRVGLLRLAATSEGGLGNRACLVDQVE